MQREETGRLSACLRGAVAAAFLLISAAFNSAYAIDEFFPTFGNRGIDVRHYAISLDVAGQGGRLDGKAVLQIKATERLRRFSLDLSRLKVRKVEIDGVPANFRQADDKLFVRLATAVPRGRTFQASISYGGAPRPIPDPTVEDPSEVPGLGWTRYRNASYVVSEPVGAGSWYPVNDVPTDKATYRFAITVDKPYIALANGEPQSVTDLGQRRRFVWAQRQPMASYLAITDVDRYRVERGRSASGVPIRNYLTSATPAASVAALRKTPQMIDFIERLIGPYPFGGYGVVMVDDPDLYYALETQSVSTFPSSWVDELTVVHELAHQWFGDAITVAQWRDLWLAEGFATYFEYLWQYRGRPRGFVNGLNELYRYVVRFEVGPAVVSRPEDLFADNTYYRGALTLEALRRNIGDAKFQRVLRSWYRAHRNGNATSADFIRLAAGIGGPGVRPLLRAWLYEQPVPPFPGAGSAAAPDLSSTAAVAAPQLGIGVRRRHAP
ncbi:MAG: M1 family metallopeptidase [Geminicoccaceae bacterium]